MTNEDARAVFLLEYCGERCDGFTGDNTCKNCEIKLALDALNTANTCDFRHFKKYTDSTLKNMSKTELIDYINMLYENWQGTDRNFELQEQLGRVISELKEQRYYKAAEIVERAVQNG